MLEFTVKTLSDAEVAAEMSRKKGKTSEWPEVLAKILTSDGCKIGTAWVRGFNFGTDVKVATAAAGLRKAAKAANYDSLVIRPNQDKTEVRIISSPVAK